MALVNSDDETAKGSQVLGLDIWRRPRRRPWRGKPVARCLRRGRLCSLRIALFIRAAKHVRPRARQA
jgi:hypothetical protein